MRSWGRYVSYFGRVRENSRVSTEQTEGVGVGGIDVIVSLWKEGGDFS